MNHEGYDKMNLARVKVFLTERCNEIGLNREVTDADAEKIINLCMVTQFDMDQISKVFAYVGKYTKIVLEFAALTQENPINFAVIMQRELQEVENEPA